MAELEQALRAVGGNLAFPSTPDLSGHVRRRLADGRQARSPLSRRTLVIALAAVLVAVGAVMVVPQARSAILDWLGIGNVTIRYVEDIPPSDLATGDLGLGERVSLERARERAGFTVMVPTLGDLDDPPKVYFREDARQVAFLYGSEDKPKLLITQAGASGAVEKLVNVGATDVELVTVRRGEAGAWLSGDTHALFYPQPPHEEAFRLVGNALIFETAGAVTVRIEAEISKDEALRIARSMR